MSKKFLLFSIFILVTVVLFAGFIKSDGNDPVKGKQNTDPKLVNYKFTPSIDYRSPNAILKYVDSLDGDNTLTGLAARHYLTYFNGTPPPGTTATWYQGDPVSIGFPAYNGPTTGFVQSDYNSIVAGNIDNWLVFPKLNVSTGDSLFFYSGSYNSAAYPDSIRVMYSSVGDSTPTAASWVELGRFRLTSYSPSLVVPWAENGFRAPTGGVNGRFAIRYCVFDGGPNGANSSTIGIDYIRVISSAAYPLNAFNLQTPSAGVTISTLPGSTTPVSITWDTSATGATYKWKYVSTSGPTRTLTIPVGTNSVSSTLGALDVILAGIGLSQGDSTVGQWDVWAFKAPSATGPDSLKSTNGPRTITLKRQKPALTAFNLISPPTNTVITSQGGDITPVISNWSKSGVGVTYKWKYASPNFSTPANVKIVLPSNNGGLDSLLTRTKGELDIILSSLGVAMGDSSVGQWRVYAYSGDDSLASTSTFNITFKRAITITIGNGTTSSNFPFTTFWKDGRTQYLYLASELAGVVSPTSITSIGFDVLTVGGPVMTDFKVSFKNTTITTLSAFETGGFTVAYNPSSYAPEGTGWQMITLTTPFNYTGGNLIVDICYNNTTYTSYSTVNCTDAPGMSFGRYNDLTDPQGGCDYTAWTLTTGPVGRANTRFQFSSIVGIENNGSNIPLVYSLSQNYPNPFNPSTKINFAIPKQGFVTLKIYDVLGREIRTLVNEVKTPGNYIVDFNAADLSSGVYFYKVTAGSFTDVKRMMLIK
jgi:hypothetical protein